MRLPVEKLWIDRTLRCDVSLRIKESVWWVLEKGEKLGKAGKSWERGARELKGPA